MDRDTIFTTLVRLRQLVEKEPCETPEERRSRKAITLALHAVSQAVHYESELELQKYITEFMVEELGRAAED